MGYLEELKQRVEELEDEVNGKDLQNLAVQNQLYEVTRPALATGLTSMLLLEMQSELYSHVRKMDGKWTPKLIASRERLEKLVEANKILDGITETDFQLKSINNELHSNYQKLRIQNMLLQKKLTAIQQAQDF